MSVAPEQCESRVLLSASAIDAPDDASVCEPVDDQAAPIGMWAYFINHKLAIPDQISPDEFFPWDSNAGIEDLAPMEDLVPTDDLGPIEDLVPIEDLAPMDDILAGGGETLIDPATDGLIRIFPPAIDEMAYSSITTVTTTGEFESSLMFDSWTGFDDEGNSDGSASLRDQLTDESYVAPNQVSVTAADGNISDILSELGISDFKQLDEPLAIVPVSLTDGFDAFRLANDLSATSGLSVSVVLNHVDSESSPSQTISLDTTMITVEETPFEIMPYYRNFVGDVELMEDSLVEEPVESVKEPFVSLDATVELVGTVTASLVTESWAEYDESGNQISHVTLRDQLTGETYFAPEQIVVTAAGDNLLQILSDLGVTEFKSVDDHTAVIPVLTYDGLDAFRLANTLAANPELSITIQLNHTSDDPTLTLVVELATTTAVVQEPEWELETFFENTPVEYAFDPEGQDASNPEIFYSMASGGPEVQRGGFDSPVILQNSAPLAFNNSPAQIDDTSKAAVTPVSAVSLPAATRVANNNIVSSNSRTSVFGTSSGQNAALIQKPVASAKLAATASTTSSSQLRKRLLSFGSNEDVTDSIDSSPLESLIDELRVNDVLIVPLDNLDSPDGSIETVTEPLADSVDLNAAVTEEIGSETSHKPARRILRATNIDQFMADFASDSFRE